MTAPPTSLSASAAVPAAASAAVPAAACDLVVTLVLTAVIWSSSSESSESTGCLLRSCLVWRLVIGECVCVGLVGVCVELGLGVRLEVGLVVGRVGKGLP